jgi:hypothetical protein
VGQPLSDFAERLRAKVGVEARPRVYEVDGTGCRMFARAVGYTDSVFFDEEYARSQGYRSIPAAPGFLGQRVYDPGQSSVEGGEGRQEMPFRRGLNGGTDIEYFDTICSGDVLTVAAVPVADVQVRQGREGPMVIVGSRHTYRRGDRVVAVVRSSLIFY